MGARFFGCRIGLSFSLYYKGNGFSRFGLLCSDTGILASDNWPPNFRMLCVDGVISWSNCCAASICRTYKFPYSLAARAVFVWPFLGGLILPVIEQFFSIFYYFFSAFFCAIMAILVAEYLECALPGDVGFCFGETAYCDYGLTLVL